MKRAKLDQNAMEIMGEQITTEIVADLVLRMTTMERDFGTPRMDAATVVYSASVGALASLVSTLRAMGFALPEDKVVENLRAAFAAAPTTKLLDTHTGAVTDFNRPN